MAEIIHGLGEVIKRLARMQVRAGQLDKPIQLSAFYMLKSIEQNFRAGGRPAWATLAPSTLRSKRGGSILTRTGAMRASNAVAFTGRGWEIRNQKSYGGFHQTGTSKMPARPFLMFQREDIPFIGTQIFMRHITS